jgi:hypothetical protein
MVSAVHKDDFVSLKQRMIFRLRIGLILFNHSYRFA